MVTIRSRAAARTFEIALLASALAAVACSGAAFSSSDGAGGDGGAGSSGAAGASGGGPSGGASGAGGGSAGKGGGSSGTGGASGGSGGDATSGAGGSAGTAGSRPAEFPSTPLLDDFNRAGPGLGLDWIGSAESFALVNQELSCGDCASAALWSDSFGPNQEVYATLASFDGDASEINLVMKALGTSCEMIEILYAPVVPELRVDYCVNGHWVILEPLARELQIGDRLGGRAHADGTVEIFVNGESLRSYDVSDYPHAEGRVGVNGLSGESGLVWDDFGGGDWR